jgi:sterol 3beta-glucosyltransferase
MSTIVIVAYGTRGDVAPLTGLGVGLQRSGHRVAVATTEAQAPLVTAAGLESRWLPTDPEEATRTSDFAQGLIDGDRMKPSKAAMREMVEQLDGVGPAIAKAAEGADLLLLAGPVSTLFGYHVAEAMDVPSTALGLLPMAATGEFPPTALGTRSLGRLGNRTLWKLGGLGEKIYLPQINALRTDLGLRSVKLSDYRDRRDAEWPILHGFSRHVVPRPADWRPGIEVTGYWWPAPPSDWQPPADLVKFLDAGEAPVYIGFGSTATRKSEELSDLIANAVAAAGVRAVVHSGWARLHSVGDNMITVDDVPHEWLFEHVAAAVHHCGAGTTAAGLRAGVPTIPVVGIMDQPFWAKRLCDLGVAAGTIKRKDLTTEWLADAIRTAVTDPSYRDRARAVSLQLQAEDGVATAVEAINEQLGGHRNIN